MAVLCVAVLATTATARGTVLSSGFHQGVLKDQHAYDRLYHEVLVDPRSLPVARALLGRLPVPEAAVTSNLKIVLPPETPVLDRVHDCERQRGRPVNFVAVDYLTIGDARGAVDALNAER
ncbi:hypothetical protein ACIGXX_07195 [Streptomyces sp. NPDC055243]|uniref:hypothetical protein n=1 Tax=Streptomyces sp. NPDC055243 TaxID=3365720 RepID=UPI0037D08CE9